MSAALPVLDDLTALPPAVRHKLAARWAERALSQYAPLALDAVGYSAFAHQLRAHAGAPLASLLEIGRHIERALDHALSTDIAEPRAREAWDVLHEALCAARWVLGAPAGLDLVTARACAEATCSAERLAMALERAGSPGRIVVAREPATQAGEVRRLIAV